MKKIFKYALVASLVITSLYAGGGKDIAPTEAEVVEIPAVIAAMGSNIYVGGGLSVDSVNSFLYGTDTVYSGLVRVGYDFNEYLGLEARGTVGVSDGDELSHDYSYGLYLKPQYAINDTYTVYGLVGYASTKISFDNEVAFNGIRNDHTTQNGFSFGAGIDYKLSKVWSLFLDATRLIDESVVKPEGEYAVKVDSIALGASFRF